MRLLAYKPVNMLLDVFYFWVSGYSMAVAKTPSGSLAIVGAPRYRHVGAVIAAQMSGGQQKINPYPKQVCGSPSR